MYAVDAPERPGTDDDHMHAQRLPAPIRQASALAGVASRLVRRPGWPQGSVIGKAELVVADAERVTLVDHLPLHTLTVVLDAIGRAHVPDVVLPVQKLDHRVLTRDVRVFDRQVTRLLPSADDDAVLRDREALAAVE